MKVLITNDDGIESLGLKILAQVVQEFADVIVVAPFLEQSGKSHSLNIHHPFSFNEVLPIIPQVKSYVVDSTPADCVRVAYYYLKEDFDIVLSGVNKGFNQGEDIFYSGTIAAAQEGILCGKKALALSTTAKSFEGLDDSLRKIFSFIFEKKILDLHPLWNINIPTNYQAIRFTFQGENKYLGLFNLVNKGFLKASGKNTFQREGVEPSSDVACLYDGFCSITPLTIKRTDYEILQKIKKKNLL